MHDNTCHVPYLYRLVEPFRIFFQRFRQDFARFRPYLLKFLGRIWCCLLPHQRLLYPDSSGESQYFLQILLYKPFGCGK